jgi:hypothetical protein
MYVTLDTPVTADGILTTAYFHGRVLAAEDLLTDQSADRARRAQLGQALGPGVIGGLEVKIDTGVAAPVLSIEPGLGINALGQTVALPTRARLALIDTPPGEGGGVPPSDDHFGPCGNAGPGIDFSGDGAYLLLIAPAFEYRGRAPQSGLGADGIAPGCGARHAVEGARLRIAPLPLAGRPEIAAEFAAIAALDDPGSTAGPDETRGIVSRFRNVLANLCLRDAAAGGQAPSLRAGTPPALAAPASLLSELAAGEDPPIGPCDLPLAVFYIDLFGLRFVDRWAARRLARPRIDAATLALLPAHGLERLLQFQDQLDELIAAAPQAQLLRVADHFRFLPPAGWFPAAGAGAAAAGLSAGGFLNGFTAGAVGRINAGAWADWLGRSFRHAPVDLTVGPCLQLLDLDENLAALGTGAATRRLRLFADRETHAPPLRDGLAIVLERAWEVYRGLSRRILRFGLPADDGSRREASAAAGDVAEIANRYAAVALAGRLDTRSALQSLAQLLGKQQTCADRLAAVVFNAAGPDNVFNNFFAAFIDGLVAQLRTRLTTSIPETGGLGLAPAVTARDLCAAVAAQESVNDLIGIGTGEGAAVGPTTLRWRESPAGQVVIPGGPGVAHVYELDNGTNRRLTFLLEATAVAATGNWTGAATILDPAGTPIAQLAVDSGTTARFQVSVAAPPDAAIGEGVAVAVQAVVPLPEDREATDDTLTLSVGERQGSPVDRAISIPVVLPVQVDRAVAPGGILTYQIEALYTATEPPTTTDFDCALSFTGPVAGWQTAIETEGPITPVGQTVTRRLTLTAGSPRPIQVLLVAPTAPGVSNGFTLSVTSVALPAPQISAARPETFTVTTTLSS